MPLTYSGRVVRQGGTAHPSLLDIAIGLSRQPRFAGQTRQWWSVLDHSLYCEELVLEMADRVGLPREAGCDEEALRLWRLGVLLHDAHEALTGDVPTTLKTDDFRVVQDQLDVGIFNAYFPPGMAIYRERWRDPVHLIDARALQAEALVVGPPHADEDLVRIFGRPDPESITTLTRYLHCTYAATPPYWTEQENHPSVREYIRRVLNLI